MEKVGTFVILCSLLIPATNAKLRSVEKWIESKPLSQPKEKPTILHFYVHDALGGPNATVWEAARTDITPGSRTSFGQIKVVDNLITAEPDRNSKELGRAQGIIASTDLQVSGLAMGLNFMFTAGPHEGSTLSIWGRNPIDSSNRELPVVGGTGDFRMARGFSISNTRSFDPVENYGVLEYTVYVF